MRIFSGIQPTGDKRSATTPAASASTPRRRSSATRSSASSTCTRSRSTTTRRPPRADARPGGDAVRDRARPRALDVFAQSHVTAHAEAAWLLAAVTSYGQLGRMTQFKEKGARQEFVSAALFTYPILMAGDILLYQADASRSATTSGSTSSSRATLRESFNARFGETSAAGGHLPGDRRADHGPPGADEKMSTTGTRQGTLRILDAPT